MREAEKCTLLSSLITNSGGTAFFYPLLSIKPAGNESTRQMISNIAYYDWIVFTSANSVEHFFRCLENSALVLPLSVKTVAVGPKTADAMTAYGITADTMPESYTGKDVAELLKKKARNKKILFPKGNLAPQTIKRALKGIAEVDEVIVYHTIEKENPDLNGADQMDSYIFMSPSAVSAFRKHAHYLHGKPVFCIGPSTALRAKEDGFQSIFTADEHTQQGIFETLCGYYKEEHQT
ncbi:uroporphyrinogen-III synthase [Fictibacillus iocasae]|uniref:Uroporphyrinogen-III synthase n=1 Tax=Fictibacillus iocasae TaxID=2715437 RepID=A0ABW2NPE6_9BACL